MCYICNMGKLRERQQRFVEHYLVHLDVIEAYRVAYMPSGNAATVKTNAYRIWANHDVQEAISKGKAKLANSFEKTKDQILKELSNICDAKITDYLDFDGDEIAFKPLDQLTEDQVKAIESIEHGKFGIRLKLHSKTWSIDRLCKMLGYDAPVKIAKATLDDLTDEELRRLCE